MSEVEVIRVSDLRQQFGKQVVLDNVNLTVGKGEILGLLGPSGSGKTTLIKAIIGMNTPANGSIAVLGHKIPSLSVMSRIGYMAQNDALYDMTAYDNLLFFGSLYGMKGEKVKKRAEDVLNLVELTAHARKPVYNFSGGMKRRLSLAIALFHQPEILILDEPTVGVDPVLRKEFWQEFQKLQEAGTTIIITTHVMDEAENCHRLAMIREGRIIALDSPEGLKRNSGTDSIEGAFLYYALRGKEGVA